MELFFRNEPGGLSDDGAKRSGIKFSMFRNGESLLTGGYGPTELDMASALSMHDKIKVSEDRNDFTSGEPP